MTVRLLLVVALFALSTPVSADTWYCARFSYPFSNQTPSEVCTSANLNRLDGPREWFPSQSAAVNRAVARYNNSATSTGIGFCEVIEEGAWPAEPEEHGTTHKACSFGDGCSWRGAPWPSSTACSLNQVGFSKISGCRADDPLCQIDKTLGCEDDDDGVCPTDNGSNPIHVFTGNKFEVETDLVVGGASPLRFVRYYNSRATGAQKWTHTYSRRIESRDGYRFVHRPDGRRFRFEAQGGVWRSDADVTLRLSLEAAPDGQMQWVLRDRNDAVERYLFDGRLVSIAARGALAQTVAYDADGRIAAVTDGHGRAIAFSHDADGRIATMTAPDGGTYAYAYDADGNLIEVTHPDGFSRRYEYGDPRHSHALTALIDESGRTIGRWEYDTNGYAVASEGAGGTNRVTFEFHLWQPPRRTVVRDALGAERTYFYTVRHKRYRLARIEGDPCTNCGDQPAEITYNANGFVASRTDRNGVQTRYTRDARGLDLSRTEAFGTPQARTITTEWHPTLRLPLKVTQGDLETVHTYDGDGRRLTETARDLSTTETRTTSYTYRADGLLETVTGPRGDVTTYAYDGAGNLASVTNALGHVTQYGDYDNHGNARLITDPNGVATTLQYDARHRLTHRTVSGRTTQFAYDPAGRLTRVTLPTGSHVDYAYDAAGRMTAIEDAAGNRIDHVLDVTGNRIEERVKSPGGGTVREHFQVFDQLSRLVESQGGAGQSVAYGYDAVGNRTTVTDAFQNQTASQYDALDRVFKQIDALQGETQYGYDVLDRLTQVVDPRGVTTGYTYNAFGDVLAVASPDAGTTVYEYDAAGNRTKQTDARGVVTEYDYDALNRLTAIRYPAHPDKDITYTWDAGPFAKGRLVRIDDDTGSIEYQYGAHGDFVGRVNTVRGTTLPLFQEFDGAGNVVSLMHPDGPEIVYTRDATDRVTAITLVEPGGQSIPLATNVSWQPFGGLAGLTFGNGLAHTRGYDLAGRVTGINTPGVQQLGYQWDATDNITAITDGIDGADSQTFGYDALYRVTDATGAYDTQSYAYDAVGNRTQLTDGATVTSYAYAQDSNRLTTAGPQSYDYDAAGNTLTDGERSYTYDARNRMAAVDSYEYGYNALGQRVFKPRFSVESPVEPDDPDPEPDPPCDPREESCEDPLPPPDPDPPPGVMSFSEGSTGVLVQVGWLLFQYDDAGRLIGEYDELGDAVRQYVWLDDMPIAMLTPNGIYYLHADHLNTPREVTDGTGQVAWSANLRPFGDEVAPGGALEMPLRFPGQYHDRETGLHQNWHREYAPMLGRYTQSDPIGRTGGNNLYVYASSRPSSMIDPHGLLMWSGTFNLRAAGYHKIGGLRGTFELTSECDLNGNRGTASVIGWSSGIGVGLPASEVEGSVTFVDGRVFVSPFVFAGGFTVNSVGFQIGPVGLGKVSIYLGDAVATSVTTTFGLDVGVQIGVIGISELVRYGIEPCECGN